MRSSNPLVIPRNHKVEEALDAANSGDFKPTKNLLKILEKPYEDRREIKEYQLHLRHQVVKYIKLFVVLNL